LDSKISYFYFDGMNLDKRILKIDLDEGFSDGRQYGKGKRGGQIQDDEIKNQKRLKRFFLF
jgi:nuclear cap-binding protein subunit 2